MQDTKTENDYVIMTSFLISVNFKLLHFVEHDTCYQSSKFQCSRLSGTDFTEEGGKRCYSEINKASAYRVNTRTDLLYFPDSIEIASLRGATF